jgi:hypothetical protein
VTSVNETEGERRERKKDNKAFDGWRRKGWTLL